MGLFDVLTGRTKPVKANLDRLFAIPGVAVTLELSANLKSVNKAAVCYKPASGSAFENTRSEFLEVLKTMVKDPDSQITVSKDEYGYEWIVVRDDDIESLTTKIHLVNKTLEDHGFSPSLLLSAFKFQETSSAQDVYWIYLYKKGTFYPFVPLINQRRDNERELALKAIVGSDLPVEPDLESWMPPWGLPL